MIHKFYQFLLKHDKVLFPLIWLITTFVYYFVFGINTELEAEKYIIQAKNFISTGQLTETRYWFYFPTIFIIAISLYVKGGFILAIILQAVINFIAFSIFFRALKKTFTDSIYPLIIVTFLLLFWPFQSWIVFLYTESIFYSSIMILVSVMLTTKLLTLRSLIYIFAALLFVIMSRPLGIIFCGGVYLFLISISQKKHKRILIFSSAVLFVISVLIINKIFSTISDWYILKPFIEENIICNFPSKKVNTDLILSDSKNPLMQLFYYIYYNTSHFLSYSFIKLKYFYLMQRPYYSNTHNFFLFINILPLYLLSCIAIFNKAQKFKSILVFSITTIILFTLAIILQCDDWHNRFILSLFPIFCVLGAIGLTSLLMKYKQYKHS